jgi:hypothetical protein
MGGWVLVACFGSSVVSLLYFPLGAFVEVKGKVILAGTVHWSDKSFESQLQLPNTLTN